MSRTVLYFSDLAILGGGEVCLLGLLRHLDRERYRPVVTAPAEGPLLGAVEELGIETWPCRLFAGMRAWRVKRYIYLHAHWRLRSNLTRLARLMAAGDVELVHNHGGMYPQNVRHVGRLARAAGVPVIWTCGYGGTYPRRVMAELIAPWVDRVIAVSASVRDRLLSIGILDPDRVTVLHHGLELGAWREDTNGEEFRRELGVGSGEMLLGTVGRVVAVKGHDIFVRAVSQLAESEPRAKFVVVGDQRPDEGTKGRHFRELQAEARRLGVGGRLIFAGWREDVPRVMASLDVLVQPSRQEAFGRTLLEAMALGKPVVATRVGGMPEVVEEGETGLMVPPEDPEALAEAMRFFIRNPDRARVMGRAGRDLLRRRFSLADRTRRVEAIYDEVLPGAAATGSRSAALVAGGEA